jgi:hypothetical protein
VYARGERFLGVSLDHVHGQNMAATQQISIAALQAYAGERAGPATHLMRLRRRTGVLL